MARLDTMVTVVDAASFLGEYARADSLLERGEALGEEDERTVTDLLVDQVEFADVLILNKSDLLEPDELAQVEQALRALNRRARIVRSVRGDVGLSSVLGTGLFDYDAAAQSAGWMRELRGEHTPETEEYGISSFVYRERRPFDADKLWALLHEDGRWEGVLRSKGFFWTAARHEVAYEWSQAGGVSEVHPAGRWWAAVPREHWGQGEGDSPDERPDWHSRYGDRTQELVFIGVGMDPEGWRSALDECLLDDASLSQSTDEWCALPSRFPELPEFEAAPSDEALAQA